MEKKELLHEGKAKRVYSSDEEGVLIQEFKNDATAFDGTKKGTITDKGKINNLMSGKLFQLLDKAGVATHFIENLNDNDMAIRSLDMLLVEAIMRNAAAGSLVRNFGMVKGIRFKKPIFELHLKNDEYHDPLMNNEHVIAMGLATEDELAEVEAKSRKVNEVLVEFFDKIGIDLIDFKLEFGRGADGKLYLGDEISPDSCRYWDKETGESVDKDRFRFDMGKVDEAYSDIFQRVMTSN